MFLLGPWATEGLLAADFKIPPASFTPNATGDGVVGPFGEVRIFNVGDGALPVIVNAAGGLAEMNLAARTPFVRIGTDDTAIILTSAGIQYGKGKAFQPWTTAAYKELIAALSKDRKKARGAILLRSSLFTAYPVAVQRKKAKVGKKMAASLAKHAPSAGAKSTLCSTRTVTETVTTTVTQTVDVIKTAEKQYQECYDKVATTDPCKAAGPLAGVCAAAVCAATTFVDMVVGFTEIVVDTTEDVVHTIVSCVVSPPPLTWPNPFDVNDLQLNLAVPQKKVAFGQKDVDDALKFLKSIAGFLGPFGTCMLEGQWSLAQLETQLNFGGANVAIPFGVKCCISSTCATQLSLDAIAGEYVTAATAALGALAAMVPEVAAALAPIGIVPAPFVVTAIAALPEVVIVIAAIILGMILVVLYWAGAIAAQLFVYKTFTDALADGLVCIEHASFALALLALLPLPGATVAAAMIPPIVTG
jgi:hypothetical protein